MSTALQVRSSYKIPKSVLDCVAQFRGNAEALVQSRQGSKEWKQIDDLDVWLATLPQAEFRTRHLFTPGLCTREIFMPAGTLLTSRIHLFEHPFVLSLGVVSAWSNEHGWETFRAPHTGITKPGTRRLLYVHRDAIWSTFHVTTETDPDKIIQQVTYDHTKLGHLTEIPADKHKKELAP